MLAVASLVELDQHVTRSHHPECQERLPAAMGGVIDAGLRDAVVEVKVTPASTDDAARVHDRAYVEHLRSFCVSGGGRLDPDTDASVGSFDTAMLAAGAGLETIAALDRGEASAGFVLVRPPGHHALASRSMGFCLLNNVAVAAGALTARGERVLIVDWDVHHGNGTQEIFWNDPNVLFVSSQLEDHWPFSGTVEETGGPKAAGRTINLPFPEGTTGDVLLRAFDEVVAPAAEEFAPTWVLVSAGFDSHRDDPLGGLGFSAGDYALFARRLREFAPAQGRMLLFLEGGYNLFALRDSVAATVRSLLDAPSASEAPTSGGPGTRVVEAARRANELARSGGFL
jgi:acetoin utilization deacetylase AcuC-like enzyme